jgi:hypothetical protein
MTAESLSSESSVLLLIDHQTGVFARVVTAPPREQVEQMSRLARAAARPSTSHHPDHQQ